MSKNLKLERKDALYLVQFSTRNPSNILGWIVKLFTFRKFSKLHKTYNHTGIAFKHNKKDYIIECKLFPNGRIPKELNIKTINRNSIWHGLSVLKLNRYDNYKGNITITETTATNDAKKIIKYFVENRKQINYSTLVACGALKINNIYFKWLEYFFDYVIYMMSKIRKRDMQCCSVNSSKLLKQFGDGKIDDLIIKQGSIYNITPMDLYCHYSE